MTDFVLMWPSSMIEQMKASGLVREPTEEDRRSAPDVAGWFRGAKVYETLPVSAAEMAETVIDYLGKVSPTFLAAHCPANPETVELLKELDRQQMAGSGAHAGESEAWAAIRCKGEP